MKTPEYKRGLDVIKFINLTAEVKFITLFYKRCEISPPRLEGYFTRDIVNIVWTIHTLPFDIMRTKLNTILHCIHNTVYVCKEKGVEVNRLITGSILTH